MYMLKSVKNALLYRFWRNGIIIIFFFFKWHSFYILFVMSMQCILRQIREAYAGSTRLITLQYSMLIMRMSIEVRSVVSYSNRQRIHCSPSRDGGTTSAELWRVTIDNHLEWESLPVACPWSVVVILSGFFHH
jgi:hypothetical protein